ncbi:MAG: DNA internalization-related competence protein ComEC/Rec2 [Ignavibacteriaceae bacterium]
MKDYPLIKFVLLFIAGIITGKFLIVNPLFIYTAAAIILIVLLLVILFNKSLSPSVFLMLLVYTLPVICGYLIYSSFNINKDIILPQNLQKQKDFIAFGKISNVELLREKEIVFECQTDSVSIGSYTIQNKVKLICKLRDDKYKLTSIYPSIYPGNIISIKGTYYKGRDERNPGEFDYNKYLNEKGISGILISYDVEEFKITDNNRDLFKGIIFDGRKYLDYQIHRLHNSQTSALLKGLILADRTEIDYETRTNFVNSGVIHVLAVSGLHVGYIAVIFIFLFGRLNPYLRSSFTIGGVLLFMLITGVPPSVFRATVMAVVIIISFLSNRSTNIFNSLALAALIILLLNPGELFNPGFQLSFSAVLSIAVIYPMFQKEISALEIKPQWIKAILLFALISLSVQIGTLPFTLIYFNKLSLAALFTNLLVIPLIGVILGIAFFTLALSIFSIIVASVASSVNELLVSFLFYLVNSAGGTDFAFLSIRQFSLIDAVIFYILLIVTLIFFYNIKRAVSRIIFFIVIVIGVVFLCSLDDSELLSRGELNLMMIDVGQGDAALLQFPNGETALIDAGETNYYFDNGERIILPLLNHLGIDKVDYGFISHMDADHYSGYVSLMHEGKIKQIIKPLTDTSLAYDLKFEKFAREMNVPVSYYDKHEYKIGDVKIYTLSDSGIPGYQTLSNNNKSSLLKIVYGKTSFLFTGDIEWISENFYQNRYKDFLKSDILKVAHHGSVTSSIPSFINYVRPSVSLISAGIKNKFSHPSNIVLNRLKAVNSRIHRTDLEGAILYKSNGDSVYYINWKE